MIWKRKKNSHIR